MDDDPTANPPPERADHALSAPPKPKLDTDPEPISEPNPCDDDAKLQDDPEPPVGADSQTLDHTFRDGSELSYKEGAVFVSDGEREPRYDPAGGSASALDPAASRLAPFGAFAPLPPFPMAVTPIGEVPAISRRTRRTPASVKGLGGVAETAPEGGDAKRDTPIESMVPPAPPPEIVRVVMKPRTEVLPIGIVSRPAGSGKSYQMMRWMAEQAEKGTLHHIHHIIACPSLDLIREHEQALIAAGMPTSRIKVITHKTGKRTIRVQMANFFRKVARTEPMVLLCSHTAMTIERPAEVDTVVHPDDAELPPDRPRRYIQAKVWDPNDWSLWWDEAPDVLVFGQQHCPHQHGIWTVFVRAIRLGNGLLRLEPALDLPDSFRTEDWTPEDFLKRIARNRPLEDAFVPISDLCGAIINPNKLVLVSEDAWYDLNMGGLKKKLNGVLDTMIITHPAAYGDYREVVMLGARLEDTMAMVLWQHLFHVALEPHPLADRIEPTHTTKRLAVHYVYEDRADRTFLSKENGDGDSMFAEMAVAIAHELVNRDEQALWNAPQPGIDKQHGVKSDFFAPLGRKYGVKPRAGKGMPYHKDTRLPGRTQGLNSYLDRHVIALLSVLRYTPEQHKMLSMLGLTPEQIDRAFQFNNNYQDALRGNIRIKDGAEVVMVSTSGRTKKVRGEGICHVYLPDRPSALDFAASFPALEGRVHRVKRPPSAAPIKRGGDRREDPAYLAMSAAERSKLRSREIRAAATQQREIAARLAAAATERGDVA
jgi:hypothetical protein